MAEGQTGISGQNQGSTEVRVALSETAANGALSLAGRDLETLPALRRRSRNLAALCQIHRLLQASERPAGELLHQIASTVAAACERPAATGVRLEFGGTRAATSNFREASGKRVAAFSTKDGRKGLLEVAYVQERSKGDKGSVPGEERDLFEAVAESLRTYFEREHAQWAVKQQAQIIEQIHDSVVSTDLDGHVLTWNRGAERLFGYSAREAVGRHISCVYDPSQHEFLQSGVIAPLKAVGEHEVEVQMRRKSGEVFYAHLRLSLLRDRRGKVTGMIGYGMDVTDRKRAEAALQEQERAFRTLTENLPGVVYRISAKADQRVVFFSKAAEETLGFSPEELAPGKYCPVESVMIPEDRRVVQGAIRKALGEVRPFTLEYRIRHKDNGIRFMLERGAPIVGEDGEVLHIDGVIFDQTERKLLEAQVLEISEREQRRVGQDLHDSLSQHLRGIVYLSHALEQDLARGFPAQAKAAARISGLLGEAIVQTRMLARGLAPLGLGADGLMSALRELAASTKTIYGIPCRFQCPRPVLVQDHSKATHLYRIAQEAVQNALRHAKASRITLRLVQKHEQIALTISDNGEGLPPKGVGRAGMGLRIMSYRAGAIGAELKIERARVGTVVACMLQDDSA